jgi:hypothetical protein
VDHSQALTGQKVGIECPRFGVMGTADVVHTFNRDRSVKPVSQTQNQKDHLTGTEPLLVQTSNGPVPGLKMRPLPDLRHGKRKEDQRGGGLCLMAESNRETSLAYRQPVDLFFGCSL